MKSGELMVQIERINNKHFDILYVFYLFLETGAFLLLVVLYIYNVYMCVHLFKSS